MFPVNGSRIQLSSDLELYGIFTRGFLKACPALTAAELRAPLETLGRGKTPGLRLVPYRAVGQPAGMLLAMRFGDVKLGKRQGPALVAFAPDRIGGSDGYQALTGGVL